MGRLEIGCWNFENTLVCNVVSRPRSDLNHTHESERTSGKVLREVTGMKVHLFVCSVHCKGCLLRGVGLSTRGVILYEDRYMANKQVKDNRGH
jgi:hypothetical protein